MMLADELLVYLLNGRSHLLAQPLATWIASSRRFTDFVDTFRDKIRKKLRATSDAENVLDLRLELETAYLLLKERPLSVVYEPACVGQLRCPDYAVGFTTRLTFMVEVTRLRADPKTPLKGPLIIDRLDDMICGKLGQLLPQHSNVLVVGVSALSVTHADLRTAMVRIQQRAERDALAFIQRYRFRDRADFFQHYQRLSEIVVRNLTAPLPEAPIAWVNSRAKHSLPSQVRTALYRSQTP